MLYLSKSVLGCYGDDDGLGLDDGSTAAAAALAQAAAAAAAAATPEAKFTQDDMNKVVQLRVKKMQETLQKTESDYKQLLASKNITDQERKSLEENLSAVQGSLRTKEQQAALERKEMEAKHASEMAEIAQKGERWEQLYRETSIERALVDAGIQHDAFQPGQIKVLLKPMTRLIEEVDSTNRSTGRHKVVVDFPDMNATTGEPEMTTRTPEEAVKRMKELPELYGNLFNTGVVSGIGSNSTGGNVAVNADGKLTAKQVERIAQNPVMYRKARQDHPEWFGLAPAKKK